MSGSCINFVINDDADLDALFANINSGNPYKLSLIRKSPTLVGEHEIQLLYADAHYYSDFYLGTGRIGGSATLQWNQGVLAKKDRKIAQEYEKYKREGWSKSKLERWLLEKGQRVEPLDEGSYQMDAEKLTEFKRLMASILEPSSVKTLGVVWSSGIYAKVRERFQIKAADFTIAHLFNLKKEVLLVIYKI